MGEADRLTPLLDMAAPVAMDDQEPGDLLLPGLRTAAGNAPCSPALVMLLD